MFKQENATKVQTTVLKMISSSGFLEEAQLTEGDVATRLSLDFAHDAVVLDVSDCIDKVDVLKDYAELYLQALHNLDADIAIDTDKKTVSIAMLPKEEAFNLDTASDELAMDDDDEYDNDEDDEDADLDEESPATSRSSEQDRLKVLTTSEMHKMAARLFSSLGESADMAAYVSFLRDFDTLLSRYGGIAAKPRMPTDDEEMAAFNTEMATIADFLVETAKKRGKKGGYSAGRSGLLSAIMKCLSGDIGDKVQTAWDMMDADDFKAAMGRVADKAASLIEEEKASRTSETKETAAEAKPICAMLRLSNPSDLQAWAKEQGFTHTVMPEEMHVTVAYSKEPVDTAKVMPAERISLKGSDSTERAVNYLGPNKALVLHLGPEESAPLLNRWQMYRDAGGSWDYDSYKPHITLSYKEDLTDEQLAQIRPYTGPLHFGEEDIKELKTQEDGQPGFDISKIPHVTL